MHRIIRKSLPLLCIAALVVLVVGCRPQTYEEQVTETRAQYTVELNSWNLEIYEPEPLEAREEGEVAGEAVAMAAEAVAAEASAEAAEEAEEGTEEEMEEEIEASGPRSADVLFDLIVRFGGEGPALPGITADIVHSDPFDEEKNRYPQWIETSGMVGGDTRQVNFVLEGIEFEDGDEFSVEFNEFVPPEERGEYREFSQPPP